MSAALIRDVDGDELSLYPVTREKDGRPFMEVRCGGFLLLERSAVVDLRDACNRFLAETGEEEVCQ